MPDDLTDTAAEPGARPSTEPRPGDGASDGRLRALLRHATIDVTPLRRYREFRLLWLGQLVTFFGSMITYVALSYQVYHLTGSSLAVGAIGAVELVPMITLSFLGGALADHLDRRRMVRLTEGSFLGLSLLLALNASLDHPQVWALFVIAGLMSAFDALQRPSLDALLPRLVDRDDLAAASALQMLRGTTGMILGPAAGGLLIATAGLPATYLVDVGTFALSLCALAQMQATPPPPDAEPPSLARVLEGVRYARSRQELIGTYAVDIVAMLFGMPMALFPALSEEYGGPRVLGLLFAAPAVGSLLATLTSGWTSRVHRHGMAVVLAASAWGASMALLGIAPDLTTALLCLGLAGAADMVSGIFRSTIWNQTIPDSLRGRLAGIELVSFSSGPALSGLESGGAAALLGLRGSIVSGGLLCVAGAAVCAALLPAFRAYDSRQHATPADQTREATSPG